MVNNNSKRLELKAEEVRAACPEKACPYENTLKIPPLEGIIGQNRAARALEFVQSCGLGMGASYAREVANERSTAS